MQGNFLSKEVQEEVKRFLLDPDRGRPRDQLINSLPEDAQHEGLRSTQQESYIDLERHAEVEDTPLESSNKISSGLKNGRKGNDEAGKMVDVVLSDMSAPWEQTTGFWKKSLSGPYNRMMNTSGINFKDHAGSMVRSIASPCPSRCPDRG
jgi:21S rRNA (uridine2791-2'-O)-methyltransferase